jgi:hypothetical protein
MLFFDKILKICSNDFGEDDITQTQFGLDFQQRRMISRCGWHGSCRGLPARSIRKPTQLLRKLLGQDSMPLLPLLRRNRLNDRTYVSLVACQSRADEAQQQIGPSHRDGPPASPATTVAQPADKTADSSASFEGHLEARFRSSFRYEGHLALGTEGEPHNELAQAQASVWRLKVR